MEPRQPSDQHRKLAVFTGRWSGQASVPPNPQLPNGAMMNSRIHTEFGLGGWFIFMSYEQERPDAASYTARGIIGYDGRLHQYTFYWFDSDGWDAGGPALGTWDGHTLRFAQDTYMGHHRYSFQFQGSDSYRLTLEHSEDGDNWSPILHESFQRTDAAGFGSSSNA